MQVILLNNNLVEEYDFYVKRNEKSLLFYSNKYRLLLKSIFNWDDYYLVLLDNDNRISGVLPTFVYKNKKHGNVINSLPFYGSNGGILIHDNNIEGKRALLNAFDDLGKRLNCVASTLISFPFDKTPNFYEDNLEYDFKDERIGQITTLENISDRDSLMGILHHKTRNMIRKAIKLNLKSEINNDEYAFRFLIETHHENMQRIGGIPKENRFFESARKIFEKEKEYNLYIAYLHNKPIAAMLIFYFNKIVEYYIPAVKNEFRHMQPLSLLIALAIEDAAKKGYKYWNWGGTWLTQEGVYRFKKRWGARDHSYYYYTRIYDDNTLYLTKEELLREYPFFYVIPFKQLEKEKNEDCISLRRVTS